MAYGQVLFSIDDPILSQFLQKIFYVEQNSKMSIMNTWMKFIVHIIVYFSRTGNRLNIHINIFGFISCQNTRIYYVYEYTKGARNSILSIYIMFVGSSVWDR
jgi:hypothetical protein